MPNGWALVLPVVLTTSFFGLACLYIIKWRKMAAGSIAARLKRLESTFGTDDMARKVRAMSEDELEARIAEIEASAAAKMQARGLSVEGLTALRMLERLAELEAAEFAKGDAK